MNTQIFAYRGLIGIASGYDFDGIIASPAPPDVHLGFVVDTSCVDISQEAFDLLKTIKRGSVGFGEFDIWETGGDAPNCLFFFGGSPYTIIDPKDVETTREYDPSLLADRVSSDVEVDPDFIQVVDNALADE